MSPTLLRLTLPLVAVVALVLLAAAGGRATDREDACRDVAWRKK